MPHRIRRRRSRMSGGFVASAVAAGLGLAVLGHHGGSPGHGPGGGAEAIAYARQQLGCPYVWGGTGPCDAGFDCSGLVMQAYAAAGVSIPRTSEQQWATLLHVPGPAPGDLVFAPGADGTQSSPGHVGLVIGGGEVIQAYAVGYPVEVSSLDAFASGAGGIIGYAQPRGA